MAGSPDETVHVLVDALLLFAGMLARVGPLVYPSLEWRSGICSKSLQENLPLIDALVEVDPRGGLFAQGTVMQALFVVLHSSEEMWTQFQETCLTAVGCSGDAVGCLKLQAYKLRVMMAHIRLKFDARTSDCTTGVDGPISAK